MRFLIVGASGFVGKNILSYLNSIGIEAIGTESRPRGTGLITFNLLEERIVDVVDKSFFSRTGQVYVVICAVVSNMDLCLTDRETSHRINVENTIQLIRDTCALGAYPIFLSTCFVFDGERGYYNEREPISPINEYARHKAEVEKFLTEQAPQSFTARLDKIVGDNPFDQQLFAYWYQLRRENKPIVCLEGSLLSPTYVIDVAKAIVAACKHKLTGIYHVSNAEFFYRDELAKQFCYALGFQPDVLNKSLKEFAFPDGRALKSYLDGSKFREITGLNFTSMQMVFEKLRREVSKKQ